MDPEQDYGGNASSLGGDSQGMHQVEARVQRMAPVIHTNLPGMPDPLNPAPTQGFPWAFPDPRGYSDHESITSSSDCASFVTMSSLDKPTQTQTPGTSGMHSRISKLRVSHKPARHKRRDEIKDMFEELNSILPSLPKGASEFQILTKAIEHIKKQNKSNQSAKVHELENMLHNTRIELQDVSYQVQGLEQQNKQLTVLRNHLQGQLQEAKVRAEGLGDSFNPCSEVFGNSYSSNGALQHHKPLFETIDNGLVKRAPRFTEISLQPVLGKLACPYYQRNPPKYATWKACTGPGFESIHRLKEHLYRRHALPSHCSRCYETFQSDVELDYHIRQSQVCDVRAPRPIEGFDKAQGEKLRSRKRTTTNEVEKWKETYRILFPGDDENAMPSPILNTLGFNSDINWCRFRRHELSKYDLHLSHEFPRLIPDELKRLVQRGSSEIGEAIHIQLIEIVRNCHRKASSSYQVSNIAPVGDEKDSDKGAESGAFRVELSTAETTPVGGSTATVLTGNTPVEAMQYTSTDMCNPDPLLISDFLFSSGDNAFSDSGYRGGHSTWATTANYN